MHKLLSRLLRRDQDSDRGSIIGFGFDFSNNRLRLKAVGFPVEILASLDELNLEPHTVASDRDTGITSFAVHQRSPKIEFRGGPHAEAVFDLLEATDTNDVEACATILQRDTTLFTDAHDGSYAPLLNAAAAGNESIATLLLESGAHPDAEGLLGMSPLHWATALGHVSLVEQLLRAGANASILNWSLLSPPELAQLNHHHHIVRVFGHFGIDVAVPNPRLALSRMGFHLEPSRSSQFEVTHEQ